MKYAPKKVYIRESGGYVELSYTDFCRRRQADQTYMDKLFIPVQGCLLEVVREQYTDFYRDKERWRYACAALCERHTLHCAVPYYKTSGKRTVL
nr:hypothetical protein IL227_00023 [uncultured bacterium]